MDLFLEIYKIPKLMQTEIDNKNRYLTGKWLNNKFQNQ